MKYYTIAMLAFLLSLSIATIQELDVMNYNQPYQKDWVDYVGGESYQNQSYVTTTLESDTQDSSLSDFRVGMNIFVKSLAYATVAMPWMLNSWGVPMPIAVLFSIPVWIIYCLGAAQLLLRFGLEGTR